MDDKNRFPIKRVYNYYYIEDQSIDSFKALLKKCPNITSIEELDGYRSHVNPEKFNQVFALIIENCNNLNEVILKNHINDSNFEEFHRKFGRKLKYLRFDRELIDLNRFPKIEKVEISEFIEESIIPQLKLGKVKQLQLINDYGVRSHMIQTIVDNFPKLTHLSLFINFMNHFEDENAIYKPLKNISNLKHLIHFRYVKCQMKSNKHLFGLLNQMAKNCRNLKSIDCDFSNDKQNFDLKQLLSESKAFPALKRLDLLFYYINNEVEDNIDVNQLFSFELFKGFENITHLTLCFYWSSTLKESILKDIDIYLPKLQYLEIRDPFDTTPEGMTQMADILSRLSRLETLKLEFKSGVDFKPIEGKITEKCRKIRKIQIKISNI